MKRLNPLGSISGLILTFALIVGLGYSVWHNRGLAFSPGHLSAKTRQGAMIKGFSSHAEFEENCSSCHVPLTSSLADKCKECHQDIDKQIVASSGVHSKLSNIDQCQQCHPDHRGNDFDPTKASYSLFNHSNTRFSLRYHQLNYDTSPLACNECHTGADYSKVEDQTCQDCHRKHDAEYIMDHLERVGENCQACHDGTDRMIQFDHGQTSFKLDGKHAEINCIGCHTNADFSQTPRDCKGCHEAPTIHQGLFDQTCDTCHTTVNWTNATLDSKPFNHVETAGFSLVLHKTDYANQVMICLACHPKDLQTFEVQTCIDCHVTKDEKFMGDHQQQFGAECMVCHDGVDRLSNFDHVNFFPLDGKHETAKCEDCHANQVYRGTPLECWQCHQEPEIHKDVFGLACNDCHSAKEWSPAVLTRHDFPLNHGLDDPTQQLQCDTCHGSTYIDYSCYHCHDHQADEIQQSHEKVGIASSDQAPCATCHPQGVIENKPVP